MVVLCVVVVVVVVCTDEVDLWRFYEQLSLVGALTAMNATLTDKRHKEEIKEMGGSSEKLRSMMRAQRWPESFELGFRLEEFAGVNIDKCRVRTCNCTTGLPSCSCGWLVGWWVGWLRGGCWLTARWWFVAWCFWLRGWLRGWLHG